MLLRKYAQSLLVGGFCALAGVALTGCGGGGGDGQDGVFYAANTTDISVEKFLAGNSHIYMQNMPNFVREVSITCDPSTTTGNATGTVVFKHLSLGELPYRATFQVVELTNGMKLRIYFDEFLGDDDFDTSDEQGKLFRSTMHVKTARELTGQDDGGWNGVYVTINFTRDGVAKPVDAECGTGYGPGAAATPRWYNDEGEKYADDSGWGGPMWASQCMSGSFFAQQAL